MIDQKYIDRFHTKYTIMPTGCWEWQFCKDSYGYGIYSFKLKKIYAHRFSAKYIARMNIDNMLVCHHCDNPSCVNPMHLFVGTYKDNTQDMVKKGRKKTVNKPFHTPLGNFKLVKDAATAHNIDKTTIYNRMKKHPKDYYYL